MSVFTVRKTTMRNNMVVLDVPTGNIPMTGIKTYNVLLSGQIRKEPVLIVQMVNIMLTII